MMLVIVGDIDSIKRYAIDSIVNKVKVELISVGPPDDDYDPDEDMWEIQGE
jgi:hypothetical protein